MFIENETERSFPSAYSYEQFHSNWAKSLLVYCSINIEAGYSLKQSINLCKKEENLVINMVLILVNKYFYLIHVFFAFSSSTEAFNLVFFSRKLVIISEFFTRKYFPHCKDDDVFGAKNVHNLAVAVGLK